MSREDLGHDLAEDLTAWVFTRSVPCVMHPVAPSCAPVALVDQTEVARKRRQRKMSRALMLTRLLVLGAAVAGAALGVAWLKHESPHPVAVDASRESPLVEARSLQPLLETASPSQLAPYAVKKGAAEPESPLFVVQRPPATPVVMPVWLVADGAGSAERLRQILRDRGARQMGAAVRFAMLNVGELLGMTEKAWSAGMETAASSENEASALLLTFYLHHLDRAGDGAGVRAFRQALEQRMQRSRAVREFILAGRSVAEFEAEMGRLYRDAGIELHFTRRGGVVFQP